VGGQRTLRPYWRNYFEQTDALVWVVDSGDRLRLGDCKEELHSLLLEDVRTFILVGDIPCSKRDSLLQRLAGASLLVFANKQDIKGSMTDKEIEQASQVSNLAKSSLG
jgi:ADP-ribosylation factor-like protein 2